MSAQAVLYKALCHADQMPANDFAKAMIEALHAAGYRVLAPGELDVETVEKCAQVAERAGKPAGASDGGTYVVGSATDAAAAIRALEAQEHGR